MGALGVLGWARERGGQGQVGVAMGGPKRLVITGLALRPQQRAGTRTAPKPRKPAPLPGDTVLSASREHGDNLSMGQGCQSAPLPAA